MKDRLSQWFDDNDEWRASLYETEQEQKEEARRLKEAQKRAPRNPDKEEQLSFVDIEKKSKKPAKKVKKPAKKSLSFLTDSEIEERAEFYIKKYAKEFKIHTTDLDKVIDYLDAARSENENIYINYKDYTFYSLLDDRDTCYLKVTGYDYETYVNLDAKREFENEQF